MPNAETPASDRFKQLISQGGEPAKNPSWPEALLEDLPEDARRLLASRKPETPLGPGRTGKLREELVSILRAQGYTIQEDVHGVRIGGHPTGRLPGIDRLSASDVVRMAADLDGGIPPPDKVRRCPKCDAVIPVDSQRCQWCGYAFSPQSSA
ncbi:MAG: zinc ribbon domain-containing protein [Chloroflexota bacterium]